MVNDEVSKATEVVRKRAIESVAECDL